MRFILRYTKNGVVSAKQIAKIEKALKDKYPSIEDVGFRRGRDVIFFTKRKNGYKPQKIGKRGGFLKRERRPKVITVPKKYRTDAGYITVIPTERSGLVKRRKYYPVKNFDADFRERFYFESINDLWLRMGEARGIGESEKVYYRFVDGITFNFIKDIKSLREPRFINLAMHFIVKETTGIVTTHTPTMARQEYKLLTTSMVRDFVDTNISDALKAVKQSRNIRYITLEKTITKNMRPHRVKPRVVL